MGVGDIIFFNQMVRKLSSGGFEVFCLWNSAIGVEKPFLLLKVVFLQIFKKKAWFFEKVEL